MPEPVGLREANGGIERGEAGHEPEPGVRHLRHRADEDLRVVVGRVEAQPLHQTLRKILGIPAEEVQQAETRDEHEGALERLEGGDGLESLAGGKRHGAEGKRNEPGAKDKPAPQR
jgi:hypothetical protein